MAVNPIASLQLGSMQVVTLTLGGLGIFVWSAWTGRRTQLIRSFSVGHGQPRRSETVSKRQPPPKASDILKPAPLYRWVPFGILSLALWGMLGFSLVMIVLIAMTQTDDVVATLHGEGLKVWAICVGVWLGLLALQAGLGAATLRRRIVLEEDGVTITGAFGNRRHFRKDGLTGAETIYSVAAMMQAIIRLRYADGSRATLDGAGFSQTDMGRVAAHLRR